MSIFFHDICLPHDATGFSIWLQEHYLEHAQFVRIFQSQTPVVFISDYNFALWDPDQKVISAWLESHEATHQQLRTFSGVGGINLADVDLTKSDQWSDWMDTHADEHSLIRSALGIT